MTKRQYDPEDTTVLQDEFLDHYEKTRAYGAACKATGVSPRQVQEWQKEPEFKERLDSVRTLIQGELEEAGMKRALGRLGPDDLPLKVFQEAFGEGTAQTIRERAVKQISGRLQGDPVLLMFFLKKLDPSYKDSQVDTEGQETAKTLLEELRDRARGDQKVAEQSVSQET